MVKRKRPSGEGAVRLAHIREWSPEEYHGDPCASGPSLSSSIAHTLVTRSPRHAWLEHPKLGARERKPTRAMDEGSILHRLILGKGAQFEIVNAPDFRQGWAREMRDEIRANGKVPLLTHDFERLRHIAERVRKRCEEEGFALAGESEVCVEFQEKGEHGPVSCRCMFDHMRRDVHAIFDLKKVATARPIDLERRIVENGLDIQEAAYRSAYEKLFPEAEGRTDFAFIFAETESEPYEVVTARLDGAFREIGRQRWMRAVLAWERLLACGQWPWPGYVDGAVVLNPPQWVIAQELGNDYATR